MRKITKTSRITLMLFFLMAAVSLSMSKRQIKYPFGLKHGMDPSSAITVIQSLGARIYKKTNRAISANYDKDFNSVKIHTIDLQFQDDKLIRVTLKTDGEKSNAAHEQRLDKITQFIKSTYDVPDRSYKAPNNNGTDIKLRFVNRYQDGSYEILIYSYNLNDQYYLSLNYEKFF